MCVSPPQSTPASPSATLPRAHHPLPAPRLEFPLLIQEQLNYLSQQHEPLWCRWRPGLAGSPCTPRFGDRRPGGMAPRTVPLDTAGTKPPGDPQPRDEARWQF